MAPLAKQLIISLSAALLLSALIHAEPAAHTDDHALIRSLLAEDLDQRTFPFPTVIEAASGKKVLPLVPENAAHQRVRSAIEAALRKSTTTLNLPDSPVRKLRRINEASRFFEDELLSHLNTTPALRCEIPKNQSGEHQRSGYPDLLITDVATGLIFYLDPKLVEQGSATSTLRTFYFEPRPRTGKILHDAVHLLVGIEHDGKDGAWTFTNWRIVDLSTTHLRLKAEFQASNAELYRKSALSTPVEPE